MKLRPATPDDADAIARIYEHYVLTSTATFELEPPSAEEIQARMAAVLEKGWPYLVAEVDGTIAGYAYAGPYRPRAAYRYTVENSVYIAREHAGKGIGTLLMQRLIAQCKQAGARQMVAVIGGAEENAASVRLHQRLGFTRVGVLQAVGWKFDRAVDSLLMQRGL